MKSFYLFRLVFLNTFKKRTRASLVIGGIAITSSAMIVLFGVSMGLHTLVTTEVETSDSKDIVTVEQRNVQQIKLNQEKLSKIQSTSGVGQVESSVGLLGDVVYHGINLNIPIYGVSKEYFDVSALHFTQGDGRNVKGTNVAVSKKVVDALGISDYAAINREISISAQIASAYASSQEEPTKILPPENFNIVAVIDKGELPVAYVPLEYLQLNGLDSVSQAKIRLSIPDKMGGVRESVEQMGFQTTSIQDTIDQINKVFTIIQRTLLIFGFILFAITVSGTFTIISLTLMEEMKQIGFLRINGMKNMHVMQMFIAQSVILTTLGALSGIVAGVIAGWAINGLARNAADGSVFVGSVSIFSVPLFQIVLVLLLAVGIGITVGLFPAKRAISVRPLDELKL